MSAFPLPSPRRFDEATLLHWLSCPDAEATLLFDAANTVREEHVGDDVWLRGLVEVGNVCRRRCTYCGLSADNQNVERYRMTPDDILEGAAVAHRLGFGTVVLQAGEDAGLSADAITRTITRIKHDFGMAITLSLGERSVEELAAWKDAGADRYLLRFETSDEHLLRRVHPPLTAQADTGHPRLALLATLRELGYEVGSGMMVGLPGQSLRTLARDIATCADLHLDMVGLGPFIPHPDTPLGAALLAEDAPHGETTIAGNAHVGSPNADINRCDADAQAPASTDLTQRTVACIRLVLPDSNIPATTAVGTLAGTDGRLAMLSCGANVVMPNCTPERFRRLYSIYPGKDVATETARAVEQLIDGLHRIGRTCGKGPGNSPSFTSRAH